MAAFDVFNGDADGICSLVQLRRAIPKAASLVTGVKRDITLLKNITSEDATDADITVLDISFEKNAAEVQRLLDGGASIDYTDHHKTGDLIKHINLTTHINLDANVCTALLVDQRLAGTFRAWAITGAFGDNLQQIATKLSVDSGFNEKQMELMHELGTLVNYNGYGASLDDLYFAPADLYQLLVNYQTPFEFVEAENQAFETLKHGYANDMALADNADTVFKNDNVAVIELKDAAWARRVSGVFSNELANQYPQRAHAVIKKNADRDSYLVSIRAPLANKQGADVIASQFPSGGGRKAAAGINALPVDSLDQFITAFNSLYS